MITAAVCYRGPRAALEWLSAAFGFVPTVVVESPDGDPGRTHYEVTPGAAASIAVSGIWAERTRPPDDSGGNTQWLTVRLPEEVGAAGLDAHCEHARSAGAEITDEPADEFFVDRRYRAVDPEGHRWTFSVHVRDVDRIEAEEFLGHSIERWE